MRLNFINIWGNYVSRIIPGKLFFPQKTGMVTKNLFTICDRSDTNFFIFTDGKDTICIDVGYISNTYLKKDFEEINIDPMFISHVFLTHTDMDHAGALDKGSKSKWFDNAKVYMSKEEEDLIKKRKRRRFLFYTPIDITRDYSIINDGDVIKVGKIKVKAIQTPGHTLGHMSYLVNDKYLFTGDLLMLKDEKAQPFYYIWNMDHKLDKESIKKIAKLKNVKVLCTAHSKCSFDFEKVFEGW